MFHTIPVIQGFFYSFTDYAGYGVLELGRASTTTSPCSTTTAIRDSYWFTFQFAIVATILINIVSLAIAIGLNAKIKFRTAVPRHLLHPRTC